MCGILTYQHEVCSLDTYFFSGVSPQRKTWGTWQVDSRQVQGLQKILDSRGGKFDGEVRKIMILVGFRAVRQDMEGKL